MKQTFNSVDSYESTVRHNLLNCSLQGISVIVSFFNNLEFFITLGFQYCLTGKNQTVLSAINFKNLSHKLLPYQVGEGMNESQITLRQRNKAAERINLNEKANLNSFNTFALNRFTLFKCCFYVIPFSQSVQLNLGNVNRVVFSDCIYDNSLNWVANLQNVLQGCRFRVRVFMNRQNSFCLIAEGNVSFVIEQFDNFTIYNVALLIIEVLFLHLQHFTHVFHNKKYLLYDPVRCRCTGGYANLILAMKPLCAKFLRGFNMMCHSACCSADFRKSACIGTVAAAYNNHHIHFSRQLLSRLLSF